MARWGGGRPTVESGITLDIRSLTRGGLVAGRSRSGSLQWTWPHNWQPICSVEYQVALSEDAGTLHLANITCFDPFRKPVHMEEQTFRLTTTTPPYGGRRWWLLCPSTGRRVMKLHLPFGARTFASRQAYRLGYAVQRESASDRARRRARKARQRIGGSPNLTEGLPGKPKWMRWATYWRHVDACQKAEGQTLELLVADAERILGRRLTS
jgi:hypothetical protein